MAVILSLAVNNDGRLEILGITVMPSEADTFWVDFHRSLILGHHSDPIEPEGVAPGQLTHSAQLNQPVAEPTCRAIGTQRDERRRRDRVSAQEQCQSHIGSLRPISKSCDSRFHPVAVLPEPR